MPGKNQRNQRRHTSLVSHTTFAMVALLVVFGIIVSVIGVWSFTSGFLEEHATTTYHIASTAAILVDGDDIEDYLAGEKMEDYARTKRYLDSYCKRISVSLIYIIVVDKSDYGRFVSVFNAVNNSVDDSSYTEWELGYKRETTNDEYRQKYRLLYEEGSKYETVYRFNPGNGVHPHITTIVPVADSAGNVTALLCIQRPIRELTDAIKVFVLRTVIFTVALALTSAWVAMRASRKRVIDPITKISDEATRFARENTKGEDLGDVSSFEEIYKLSRSIDKMETDMVSYVENLTSVTAERERIGTELAFAKGIQSHSLPHTFPAFPERTEFDIYASMTPAKEVGGDFYNFAMIDDDHLALWIADVSDKGVPAALFMMAVNIVTDIRTSMGGTPAEIMEYINNHVCEHNSENMFVTVWLGILEISTGKITACNAGHEDPAVYHCGGAFELFKTKHNVPVGTMPDIAFRNYEIQLEKGDKLFLYTDGVPEATDSNDTMYGTERMLDALNEHCEKTPQEILEGVHASVNGFAGDRPQFDDLTMLCIGINSK